MHKIVYLVLYTKPRIRLVSYLLPTVTIKPTVSPDSGDRKKYEIKTPASYLPALGMLDTGVKRMKRLQEKINLVESE